MVLLCAIGGIRLQNRAGRIVNGMMGLQEIRSDAGLTVALGCLLRGAFGRRDGI